MTPLEIIGLTRCPRCAATVAVQRVPGRGTLARCPVCRMTVPAMAFRPQLEPTPPVPQGRDPYAERHDTPPEAA